MNSFKYLVPATSRLYMRSNEKSLINGSRQLLLASAYLPDEQEDDGHPAHRIGTLVDYSKNSGFNIVIGCNTNALHIHIAKLDLWRMCFMKYLSK